MTERDIWGRYRGAQPRHPNVPGARWAGSGQVQILQKSKPNFCHGGEASAGCRSHSTGRGAQNASPGLRGDLLVPLLTLTSGPGALPSSVLSLAGYRGMSAWAGSWCHLFCGAWTVTYLRLAPALGCDGTCQPAALPLISENGSSSHRGAKTESRTRSPSSHRQFRNDVSTRQL